MPLRLLFSAILCALTGLLFTGPVYAQTLEEALAQAYMSNPTLDKSRAQLKATDELVPQAKSGYRPRVDAEASAGKAWVDRQGERRDSRTPATVGVVVTQPLYRGGRTVNSVQQSKRLVDTQRSVLLSTEQSVLLSGATAYLDVVRDQAVVSFNANNEQVLRRQYQAERDRFDVGAVTRTDVSQSQSRLARATADRIAAEGFLEASRATFVRVLGLSPGELKQPNMKLNLPSSLDEAVERATLKNPDVMAATYAEQAAHHRVDVVRGELLPEANLVGRMDRDWDSGSGTGSDRMDSASVIAQLRIPLYEAGAVTSRVREAKHTANQRRIEIEEARRLARENAVRAWQSLTSARAEIKSREAQIKAAQVALDGTRQEANVGTRTTLDVLDAEQELLDARVNLVRAQRNESVASFELLAAVGDLTASNLGLSITSYDPERHYKDVKDSWWGTGVSEYDSHTAATESAPKEIP